MSTRPRPRRGTPNIVAVIVLIGLIVALAFFLLGGRVNLGLTPGNIDVQPPDASVDVNAPQVDVDPGRVDVEPPSVDVRRPGEEND